MWRHISIGSNSPSHCTQNFRSHSNEWFAYQLNNYQMATTNTVIWNPFISGQKGSSKKKIPHFHHTIITKFERLCFRIVFSNCLCVYTRELALSLRLIWIKLLDYRQICLEIAEASNCRYSLPNIWWSKRETS